MWHYKVRLACLEKKAANLLCVLTRVRAAQWMLILISLMFSLSAALDADTHRLPTRRVVFVAHRSELTSSGRWCLFHIPIGYPSFPRFPSLMNAAKGVYRALLSTTDFTSKGKKCYLKKKLKIKKHLKNNSNWTKKRTQINKQSQPSLPQTSNSHSMFAGFRNRKGWGKVFLLA